MSRPEHEANRQGWNEGALRYEEDLPDRIEFLKNGGTNFVAPEYKFLKDLDKWCQRAIHLQCAGGTDTLSLWNLGAQEVIGVDISDQMIEVAKKKGAAIGANAQWIRCDVLDTPAELNATADLVYTGRGALCWLMDLDAWAATVVRLLKPGGRIYVFEGHPFSDLFALEPSEFVFDQEYGDYFCETPHESNDWPTTYIGELDLGREPSSKFERQWKLSDIINSVLDSGLILERIEEHPDPFWEMFPNIPPDVRRCVPQTFSLLAVRP